MKVALNKQLELAKRKLSFYREKELFGGLSLDQEFALTEDISKLETLIVELEQRIDVTKSNKELKSESTSNQRHTGIGDNIAGSKITNNYYNQVNDKPRNGENQQDMKSQEILSLIDRNLDEAFDILDDYFSENATYLDLSKEYISPPNNFSVANFRSKLKRFIKLNYKN